MYSDGNMKKNIRPLQRGPLGYLSHDVKKNIAMGSHGEDGMGGLVRT